MSPEASMSEVLRSIQFQLTMQTKKMNSLADKEDVKDLSSKVEGLAASVAGHTSDLATMKKTQDDDQQHLQIDLISLNRK